MHGAPRLLPAASVVSILDQVEDMCGGRVSVVPAPEWRGDKHRVVLASHPQAGSASRANPLAGRVLGVPVYGPCVLARAPARDGDLYRAESRGTRRFVAFDTQGARAVLASLGEEVEAMHSDHESTSSHA